MEKINKRSGGFRRKINKLYTRRIHRTIATSGSATGEVPSNNFNEGSVLENIHDSTEHDIFEASLSKAISIP